MVPRAARRDVLELYRLVLAERQERDEFLRSHITACSQEQEQFNAVDGQDA
jgi:hypothetical protein